MVQYDFTIKMSEDIILIDSETFNDISICGLDLLQRLSTSSNYEVFIKYIANIPVGFIGLMHVDTPHYSGTWIDLIAVRPDFQKQGFAKEMIDFSKKYISETRPDSEMMSALVRKGNFSSNYAFKSSAFKNDGNGDFELLFFK